MRNLPEVVEGGGGDASVGLLAEHIAVFHSKLLVPNMLLLVLASEDIKQKERTMLCCALTYDWLLASTFYLLRSICD